MDHFEGRAGPGPPCLRRRPRPPAGQTAAHGPACSMVLAPPASMAREADMLRLQPLGVTLELRGTFRSLQFRAGSKGPALFIS